MIVENITTTKATVSWLPNPVANRFKIRYKAAGSNAWIYRAASGTGRNLSGLTPDTRYKLQVRSECTGENSGYSPAEFFRTRKECPTPVELSYQQVGPNKVKLMWMGNSNGTGGGHFKVRFRMSNGNAWTYRAVTGTSKTLWNLAPGTKYKWQVRTECSGGNSSYAVAEFFRTPGLCEAPLETFTSGAIDNMVTFHYFNVPGVDHVRIRYRMLGGNPGPWTYRVGMGEARTVHNIEPQAQYEWQIRSECSFGHSAYSQSMQFIAGSDTARLDLNKTSKELKETVPNGAYPNPFKTNTTVQYEIQDDAHVLVEAYNMLGERVAVIVNDNQSAGVYNETFRSNAGPGVYFITISVNGVAHGEVIRVMQSQ